MKKTRKLLAVTLALAMLMATGITATAAQTVTLPLGIPHDDRPGLVLGTLSFSNVTSYKVGYTENNAFPYRDAGRDSNNHPHGFLGSSPGVLANANIYTIHIAKSTSIVYKRPAGATYESEVTSLYLYSGGLTPGGRDPITEGIERGTGQHEDIGTYHYVMNDSYYQIDGPGVFVIALVIEGARSHVFLVFVDENAPVESGPAWLEGADDWAKPGLTEAYSRGLVIDAMIGNWKVNTNRLQAADAMVNMIESVTGKSLDQVAAEKGFDMNDRFSDTDSKAATFLKASGISTGVDGVRYDARGTFSRAQMVTMIGRMAENIFDMDLSGAPLGSVKFNDILNDAPWADQYVGWAAEVGITQGLGGDRFGSRADLQNQQTGVFMSRAFDVLK